MDHPRRGTTISMDMAVGLAGPVPVAHRCVHSLARLRIAATMLSAFGITAFSSTGLYGVGANAPLSRLIGASRLSKPASATTAEISAATLQGANVSSTIKSRPVFFTEERIV